MACWWGLQDDETGLLITECGWATFSKKAPWSCHHYPRVERALATAKKKLRRKVSIVPLDSKDYRIKEKETNK